MKNDLGLAGGGMDTNRIPPEERERRLKRRADARRAVVTTALRMFPGAEVKGSPAWVAAKDWSVQVVRDLGLRPADDDRPAPTSLAHINPDPPRSYPAPARRQGRCPVCEQLAPLTAVGLIDRHPAQVVGAGGKRRPDLSRRCGGFTRYPQETK